MTIATNNNLGKLVLVRHGETAWAKSGQFTGRTDLPLTTVGKQQARTLSSALQKFNFINDPQKQIFVSPLQRAQQTARQAGIANFQTSHNLAEWDYGPLEGHTAAEISGLLGHDFSIWIDGVLHNTASLQSVETPIDEEGNRIEVATLPGETISAVKTRAQRFIDHISMEIMLKKDILVIAHSQILRVLACCWLGIDPKMGGRFVLDTASISTLGINAGQKVVFDWNQVNY